MYKNLRWKFLAICRLVDRVLGVSFASLHLPPSGRRSSSGLDLKGGVHLVLQVQTDDALRVETETTAEQLRDGARRRPRFR